MWPSDSFITQLGILYPIIQAPMAGVTTPQLVAEVSNAGGLGSFGGAYLDPASLRDAIREIKKLTAHPFAINLFVPEPKETCSLEKIHRVNQLLEPYRKQLNLKTPENFCPQESVFEEQLEVILEEGVPIFSFTFGILPKETIQKIKSKNILTIGTATTTREAILLEKSGVDMITAQGFEAGGHRGTDATTEIQNALIGSIAFIPQVVDAVKIPAIAAGGIMDGRGILAALALGASAVQMGTAFLTCPEANIHPGHREALLNSTDESTRLTRAFTGKFARSIQNQFLLDLEPFENTLPGFAWQSALTRDIRVAAANQNRAEFMSLWSGQASRLCQSLPAKELIQALVNQVSLLLNER